jgi:hypothetical protein
VKVQRETLEILREPVPPRQVRSSWSWFEDGQPPRLEELLAGRNTFRVPVTEEEHHGS